MPDGWLKSVHEMLSISLADFIVDYPDYDGPIPRTVEEAFDMGWTIDHIFPVSLFKQGENESRVDFLRRINRPDNLRLLPSKLNFERGNSFDDHARELQIHMFIEEHTT